MESLHLCPLCLHQWRVPQFALKFAIPPPPPGDRHLATPPPSPGTRGAGRPSRANGGDCKGDRGYRNTYQYHNAFLHRPGTTVYKCVQFPLQKLSTGAHRKNQLCIHSGKRWINNSKKRSAAEKFPQLWCFHARLRQRESIHSGIAHKYGRFPPEPRYNCDQILLTFVNS